jgi:branched-chain amino acid transport system ATP-binding protein
MYLDEGEIIGFVGPNGAGKSTVLKAIFGLSPIDRGEILWHNHRIIPVPKEMVHFGLSYVPQGRRVFPHLTVKENLEIGAVVLHNTRIRKQYTEEILDLFPQLETKMAVQAGILSGGEQQMLALARGMMTNPTVLLLDEPSLGLAPRLVKDVFAKIREINNSRKTAILVVEHNVKALFGIVDRVYVLDNGRIVGEGPSQNIVNSGILEKVFLAG